MIDLPPFRLSRKVAVFALALLFTGDAHAQDSGDTMVMGSGRMVRGTVTATAPGHLSMKTESGETFQVALTPNTQVRKGRDPIKAADVHIGDGIGAAGEIDTPNHTVHALYLFIVDAEQLKKARENMGKTYITGKITAIDELKLTILRSDNVTQTITVDEDTSFRRGGRGMNFAFNGGTNSGVVALPGNGGQGRGGAATGGGESITLADIKVGDNIAGQGSLKNGLFVPTQLMVADPAAAGRRHRQPEGNTPGPNVGVAEPK